MKCALCLERPLERAAVMCKVCGAHFDRHARAGLLATSAQLMTYTAARVRFFERRRARSALAAALGRVHVSTKPPRCTPALPRCMGQAARGWCTCR